MYLGPLVVSLHVLLSQNIVEPHSCRRHRVCVVLIKISISQLINKKQIKNILV